MRHLYLAIAWLTLLSPGCDADDSRPDAATATATAVAIPDRVASFTASDASPVITLEGTPVISANWVFWGAAWNYAGSKFELQTLPATPRSFVGKVEGLGLTIDGNIASSRPNVTKYDLKLNAKSPLTGITGGGLEFKIDLDSLAVPASANKPQLLDGNRGWRWALGGDQNISVTFDPPLSKVHFEGGNPGRIRCMIVGSELNSGKTTQTMTITLPAGSQNIPSPADRYDVADVENWPASDLPYDTFPVDVSFLNHRPAGKHGMVRRNGADLEFADGTPARFWGGNIAAYAIYSDPEEIRKQAKRIAAMGFNLMRIHHHDSSSWVSRTVIDENDPTSQKLDSEVMTRLDWWIKCLKDEGIYVWLDLHVGRRFKSGDNIPDFEELADDDTRPDGEAKGYMYFNERVAELLEDFNAAYLSHVNTYTHIAYRDEPAIMGLLLSNENDLTHHFGNLMLADKGNPQHHRRFAEAATQFAGDNGLSKSQVMKTWEPGASKLFLADREHQLFERLTDHLRSIGDRHAVAVGHMWANNPMYSLPSLAAGDIIDVHSYGDAEALSADPRYQSNFIDVIATGALTGYPVAITEWNVPYPAVDRFTAPWYLASVAALQGWDAPMIYNYTQSPLAAPRSPQKWDTFADPAIAAAMPAAALMYRRGDVRLADKHVVLQMDQSNLIDRSTTASTMAALRTGVERHQVTIGLPAIPQLKWHKATETPVRAHSLAGLDHDFAGKESKEITSDTGQLTRNWAAGYQIINTPKTQAVHGFVGGLTLKTADVIFEIQNGKAAIAISSLDDQPIRSSGDLLLSVIARAEPDARGQTPLRSEPIAGVIKFKNNNELQISAVTGRETSVPPRQLQTSNGYQIIGLGANVSAPFYRITISARDGRKQ